MAIARTAALALTAAAITAAAAACSGAAPKPTTPNAASTPTATTASTAGTASRPNSPAGVQARWFLDAVAALPITNAQASAHFDQAFLAQVTPSKLNSVLAGARTVRLDAITAATPTALVMTVTANGSTKLTVHLAVDSSGLISGLLVQPAETSPASPVPTSWAGVDRQIRSVAP